MDSNNLYIDNLSGEEFEQYLATLFQKLGYQVELTKGSGDYGADLIIVKNNERKVIQAKRYNSSVGISAVQEVIGSKEYYKALKCMVVTNNYFTPNAKGLAEANNVELWDRDILMKMITISLGNTNIKKEQNNQSKTDLINILSSDVYKSKKSKYPLVIGKNNFGNIVTSNLSSLINVLISGTTGSGKSVFIQTLIISLLNRYSPEELKFLMIDPRIVELSIYNGLPYLLIPVVTNPKKSLGALNWSIKEMNRRYKLLADNSVRNIESYNKLFEEKSVEDMLPSILIIIDELEDVVKVSPDEISEYIVTLVQKSRAVGIHLIVSTQNPSIASKFRDIFPSKISFLVSSRSNSKAILGIEGAEKLSGRGDMLFHPIYESKPIRIKGAIINDKDIKTFINTLKDSIETLYRSEIMEDVDKMTVKKHNEEIDALFNKALKIILDSNEASASILQRKLRIGYNRAAKILNQLEDRGIISGRNGLNSRQMLINKAEFKDIENNTIDKTSILSKFKNIFLKIIIGITIFFILAIILTLNITNPLLGIICIIGAIIISSVIAIKLGNFIN